MSSEVMNLLIEGFDSSKLKSENEHYEEAWKEIIGAYQNKKVIQADVVAIEDLETADGKKQTCAVVQMDRVRGYIPIDEFGVQTKKQLRSFAGKPVGFVVLKYDRENDIFIASRKQGLEIMSEIWLKRHKEGDVVVAVARSVSPSLVRADIGGIEVKIPIEDIRYGWIDDLEEEIKVGDHFYVKVLEINREEKTVKVSAKATQKNPFPECLKRYKKGSEHTGVVSGVTEYGVFVNLEPGVDSLARHLRHENVKKGDRVLVRIVDTDPKEEHIMTKITRII